MFWNIETELLAECTDDITLYQLLRDIEGMFLTYTKETEGRICQKKTNVFLELRAALEMALPRYHLSTV